MLPSGNAERRRGVGRGCCCSGRAAKAEPHDKLLDLIRVFRAEEQGLQAQYMTSSTLGTAGMRSTQRPSGCSRSTPRESESKKASRQVFCLRIQAGFIDFVALFFVIGRLAAEPGEVGWLHSTINNNTRERIAPWAPLCFDPVSRSRPIQPGCSSSFFRPLATQPLRQQACHAEPEALAVIPALPPMLI
jgi:hypothetical protein